MGAVLETCASFIRRSGETARVAPEGVTAVKAVLMALSGSPALVLAVAELVTFTVHLKAQGIEGTPPLMELALSCTDALRALGPDGHALAAELEERGRAFSRFVGAPRAEGAVPTPPSLASVKASPLARFTLASVGDDD